MLLEITGGILSNSLAIVCDGFHLLTDLAGFIISLISTYLATRKPTKRMNFGYRRYEILGAFISVILIWLLSAILLYLAIERIIISKYEIKSELMIIMALIGVLINGLMALILSYSHLKRSCSAHKQEQINQMVSKNINIRAAFIHILGDMIQSMGVLIASLIVYFRPSIKIADPICTIIFSVIVLFTTIPIVGDIVNVLTESFPLCLDYDKIETLLLSFKDVKKVLDLKCWYLNTSSYALNASIAIETNRTNTEKLLAEIRQRLVELYNFEHINIQLEYNDSVTRYQSQQMIKNDFY